MGEAHSISRKRQPSRPQESRAALMQGLPLLLCSHPLMCMAGTFPTPLPPAPPLSLVPGREDSARFSFAGPLSLAGGSRDSPRLRLRAQDPAPVQALIWPLLSECLSQHRAKGEFLLSGCQAGTAHAWRHQAAHPCTSPAPLTPLVFTYSSHLAISHGILSPDFCRYLCWE